MPRCKSPPGNGWAQGIRGARQAGGQAGAPADRKMENNADDCERMERGAGLLSRKGRKLGERDGLSERVVWGLQIDSEGETSEAG